MTSCLYFLFCIFIKHEIMWTGERCELREIRTSRMEMAKMKENLKQCVCKGASPKPRIWWCEVPAVRVAALHGDGQICPGNWPIHLRGLLQAGWGGLGMLGADGEVQEMRLNVSISSCVSDPQMSDVGLLEAVMSFGQEPFPSACAKAPGMSSAWMLPLWASKKPL